MTTHIIGPPFWGSEEVFALTSAATGMASATMAGLFRGALNGVQSSRAQYKALHISQAASCCGSRTRQLLAIGSWTRSTDARVGRVQAYPQLIARASTPIEGKSFGFGAL